jgi:ribonuclease HI
MSTTEVLTIHTDGAARGNPGPAAFAYVIARHGVSPIEEAGCLGRMTNNQAEYTALVRALEHAARLGTGHRLVIHSDSELMIKQMRGEYRVKNEELRDLYRQARALSDRFAAVSFRHVRREHNRRADELCNEALDGRRSPSADAYPGAPEAAAPAATETPAPATLASRREAARNEVLACLRAAAAAWAQGNATEPGPEKVTETIWKILETHRVLRRAQGR